MVHNPEILMNLKHFIFRCKSETKIKSMRLTQVGKEFFTQNRR